MSTVARILMCCCAALLASAASAAGGSGQTSRVVREAPIKDCTRINGRYGYYGNPWCTPAEQARWDNWTSTQRKLR
jgi:hypothetical protein